MPDYKETVARGIRSVLTNLPTLLPESEVKGLSEWLTRHQGRQLELVVRNHRQAGRLEVVRHLLAQCRASGSLTTSDALALAERTASATRGFAPPQLLQPLAQDLRAEALGWLGNAFRRAERFKEAKLALAEAFEAAAHGSGDPNVVGGLYEKRSDIETEFGDFKKAESLLKQALHCYRRVGETGRETKAQIRLARVYYLAGDPRQSAQITLQALRHMVLEENPFLYLQAFDGLLHCLEEAGEALQAFLLLRSQNHLFLRLAPPILARRHRWLTARLYLGISADREIIGGAIRILNNVREEFLADNMLLDAALCSLDLALAYARRGESLPQSRLAEEMFPVFAGLQIEREATAALLLYADAARKFRATVGVVEEARQATHALRRGIRPLRPKDEHSATSD
jgi:tetratricopeptide (TPR) repeat protein